MIMEAMFKKFAELTRISYAQTPIPVLYENWIREEAWVPMSDDIRLKAYIYKPAPEEETDPNKEWPVILQRTCYPHTDQMYQIHGEELAKRGFAYVYVYCRGTETSEGVWVPNEHERQDGLDTLEWLCTQTWVESIGYWGSSYLALTGWAMADALPDKVQSMYLGDYGTDRHTSAYEKRLFRHDVLTSWAMENAGFKVEADYIETCKYRPQAEVDEKLWGQRVDWYRDWITNIDANQPYWQSGFWKQLREIPKQVKVPIYLTEGWYDHHLGSALKTYECLGKEAKDHTWFEIGCWNHFGINCLTAYEPKQLKNEKVQTMLEWFDLTLRKKQLPKRKAMTYIIGEDCWREWPQWPMPAERYEEFYLNSKESEKQGLGQKMPIDGQLAFDYDPENPVSSHGAESMLHTMNEVGSLIQPEPGYRKDVISFVSEPVTEALKIVGKINVSLFVSTDGEDTAFTAKLMEVKPDGTAYNIRSSITTIGAELSAEKDYIQGEVVNVTVDMWDIAWTVSAGSKLRLDISSSDFPQYAVHSNYKGCWAYWDKSRVARQTIYFGEKYPSRVILPIIEY